jgi:hypothetical protein
MAVPNRHYLCETSTLFLFSFSFTGLAGHRDGAGRHFARVRIKGPSEVVLGGTLLPRDVLSINFRRVKLILTAVTVLGFLCPFYFFRIMGIP